MFSSPVAGIKSSDVPTTTYRFLTNAYHILDAYLYIACRPYFAGTKFSCFLNRRQITIATRTTSTITARHTAMAATVMAGVLGSSLSLPDTVNGESLQYCCAMTNKNMIPSTFGGVTKNCLVAVAPYPTLVLA